jgi:hypothetical protein
MRRIALIGGFVALLGLVGCGATPQDVEEIKKGQQDILAKLASLDTDVKELKSRPPRRPHARQRKTRTRSTNCRSAGRPSRVRRMRR